MKFKSALMTQASGSIAGMTASRNRGGAYFRARVIPVNPNTERQGQARANMSSIVGAWTSLLTEANRDAWAAYAAATPVIDRLGDQLILSGQQMFIKSNLPRLVAGKAIVAAGPVAAGLATTPVFSATPELYFDGNLEINATVEGVGTAGFLSYYTSEPVMLSRTAAHAKRAWAGVSGAPVADAFTIAAPASGLPYTYSVGQKVRVSAVYLADDGRVSAEIFADIEVGET